MAETLTAIGLACGAGIRQSRLQSGAAYGSISPAAIAALARNPPSVDKLEGLWFLPSTYRAHDARQHEAQRLRGAFHMLVLDIDTGDLPLDDLRGALKKVIGPASYLIYATKSASLANRKWRALVPVAIPVKGHEYEQVAGEFMVRMEEASHGRLVLDRAATRAGQVYFLPNRGEFYEFEIEDGDLLYNPPALTICVEPVTVPPALGVQAQKQTAKTARSGDNSPIKNFNEAHDLVELLLRYGYVRDGQSFDFRSPLQTTQSFATRIYPETGKWVSQSGSDAAAGLGKAKDGYVYGDSFDIYAHFEHTGNVPKAIATWASCAGIEQAQPAPTVAELPAPATLDRSGLAYLQEVLDEHRGDAAHVFAVALRLSLRVPHQWSLEAVREFISGYAEEQVTSAIMHRIERAIATRNTTAMRPTRLGMARMRTSLKGDAVDHAYCEVDHLAPLSDALLAQGGIFAIRAPMGSGKTQEIGRPLADWAKNNGRSFMAIAHRISLVAEMARRLDLSDYRGHPNIDQRRMAVCLPSILKGFAQTKPEVVFIDEILQALQFLVSEDCCRTSEGGPAEVFKALCKLIQDAHVVVVADANMNDLCIELLAYCRHSESITIIEMVPTTTEKVADLYCGISQKVRGAVSSLVLKELQAGGKVWLAVESPKLAKVLQHYLAAHDYRVLCVHSEVKGQQHVAALIADADFNSRCYDIVIASPVISSGVSIEHRGRPHFTLGAYVGGGWATTPTDAMQQLGRVRYLRRFIVGIEQNNIASGGQVWFDEIKGRLAAATLEQSSTARGPFDGLIAHIKATHENARADFGAGLYWHLEAAGWAIQRQEITEVDETISAISKSLKEAHHCALIDAGHVDDDMADLLRRMPETEAIAIKLEAHAIQRAFAVNVVSDEELSLWADGLFARTIERFEDAFCVGSVAQDQAPQIVHRSLRIGRRAAYSKLLDGIDIKVEDWGTREVLEEIVDRIMVEPQLYVACGILPKKYATRRQRRDDTYKPIRRPQNVGIVAEEILALLGLRAIKARVRIDGKQIRLIGTDMEIFGRILRIAERRAAQKVVGTYDWGEDDDVDL
jgi:hypothetical protein